MSSASSPLPKEICVAAERGELPKVVKWLRKGGHVDALCSGENQYGVSISSTLLHTAAAGGHLAVAKEVLKRGAAVNLPDSLGGTALIIAALRGQPAVLLLLLEHSANPDLQDDNGWTALMLAAFKGHEACAKALLRANANTELREKGGRTALQLAEAQGHTAVAELIRQQAAPQQDPKAKQEAAQAALAGGATAGPSQDVDTPAKRVAKAEAEPTDRAAEQALITAIASADLATLQAAVREHADAAGDSAVLAEARRTRDALKEQQQKQKRQQRLQEKRQGKERETLAKLSEEADARSTAEAAAAARREEREAAARQAEEAALSAAERSFGECAVCMEDMLLDHGRLALDCGHLFHRHCVLKWLEKESKCPLCNHRVVG